MKIMECVIKMKEKLCLCSAMEAGEFDNKYRYSDNRPETINWSRNSDGSYETGTLKNEEFCAKVRCRCGRYMKTHLVGRYHKKMVVTCSCGYQKPEIMECVIEMTETHKREESDVIVSIGHDKLIANISGFAREVTTEDGSEGVLIFIPTGVGKSLLDLIEVKS